MKREGKNRVNTDQKPDVKETDKSKQNFEPDMEPFPKMPDRELPPVPEGWHLHGGFYDFQ